MHWRRYRRVIDESNQGVQILLDNRRKINDGSPLTALLAYCNDIVVGAVCCRIDQSENRRRLYIMTLGVLAKYRELGLGNPSTMRILVLPR